MHGNCALLTRRQSVGHLLVRYLASRLTGRWFMASAKASPNLRALPTSPSRAQTLPIEEVLDALKMIRRAPFLRRVRRRRSHFRRKNSAQGRVPALAKRHKILVAARERMLVEGIDAASAAFEVGYESASQFNREYKRFFGQPPMRHIKVRRLTGSAMISD